MTNDFTSDNRVLRAALASREVHENVIVFCLHRLRAGLPDRGKFDGIEVRRFRLKTLNWPKRLPVQILKYLEAVIRMVQDGVRLKPKLIHAHDLDGLIIGFGIARISKSKLLYDSHELHSESKGTLGYPRIVRKILLIIERMLARRVDGVVTVSAGIANAMAKKLRISPPGVIRNFPVRQSTDPLPNKRHPLRNALNLGSDVPIILYQGGLTHGRGLLILLNAMQEVKCPGAVLVFLGNGVLVSLLRERARSLNLENRVYFHPAVESSALPMWTADATIGVHPMEGFCLNHQLALPNKIFEYIQAQLPVLVSNLPEMREIVRVYGVGKIFQDGDATNLALQLDTILGDINLLNRYKRAARTAAGELNWEKEKTKLIKTYRKLC